MELSFMKPEKQNNLSLDLTITVTDEFTHEEEKPVHRNTIRRSVSSQQLKKKASSKGLTKRRKSHNKKNSSSLVGLHTITRFLEGNLNDARTRSRSSSLTRLYEKRKNVKKEEMIVKMRKQDNTLRIKKNVNLIAYIPGTSLRKKYFSTSQTVKELKRSKSLPESVLHLWKASIDEKEAKRTSSSKPQDPFSVSDHKLMMRMAIEEKHDLKNILTSSDGEILEGTFRALVRRLTTHLQEPEYFDAFLLTYDQFVDHESLLITLILLFRCPLTGQDIDSSPMDDAKVIERSRSMTYDGTQVDSVVLRERTKRVIQHRILNILQRWIELRLTSLKSRKQFYSLYKKFCEFLSNSSDKMIQNGEAKLKQAISDTKKERRRLRRNLELSKPSTPRKYKSEYKYVHDITPYDIAKQLTLMDQYLFGKTKWIEYKINNFSKDKDKAPGITALTDQFNKNSYWIASSIILGLGTDSSPKERAKIISHFILVLSELRKMNNFNSMMVVYSALNMTPVTRLKKTWSYVSQTHKDMFAELGSIFENNYSKYRTLMELSELPCIPIQGVLLKDITFIEENLTIGDNGWINFSKMLLLGRTYKSLKMYQSVLYDFKSDDNVQFFIDSQVILTSDELYEKSRTLEMERSPSRSNLLGSKKESKTSSYSLFESRSKKK